MGKMQKRRLRGDEMTKLFCVESLDVERSKGNVP